MIEPSVGWLGGWAWVGRGGGGFGFDKEGEPFDEEGEAEGVETVPDVEAVEVPSKVVTTVEVPDDDAAADEAAAAAVLFRALWALTTVYWRELMWRPFVRRRRDRKQSGTRTLYFAKRLRAAPRVLRRLTVPFASEVEDSDD